MQWLTDAGLGLDDQTVRLERTTQAAVDAGARLRDDVADLLAGVVAGVEQVGSSSVVDLLAKPIVDLAVGLTAAQPLAPVCERLKSAGWVYRGDAGAQGGHVFVLRVRPGHRVAHIHGVDHDGDQWRNYLRLRDLLRRSSDARARYAAVKQRLAAQVGDDRVAYTDGKSDVVAALLASA